MNPFTGRFAEREYKDYLSDVKERQRRINNPAAPWSMRWLLEREKHRQEDLANEAQYVADPESARAAWLAERKNDWHYGEYDEENEQRRLAAQREQRKLARKEGDLLSLMFFDEEGK